MPTFYDLPILIRNKKYVSVKLESSTSEQENSREFLLDESDAVVFKFISNTLVGHTLDDDLTFSINEVSLNEGVLEIKLKAPGQELISEELNIPDGVKISPTGEVSISRVLTKVSFNFKKESETYTGGILFERVARDTVHNIIMDFGSEASQLTSFSTNTQLERLRLVERLKTFYDINSNGERVHQEDNDNQLYRSFFFVKTKDAIFQPSAKPNADEGDEILPLLTKIRDIDRLQSTHRLVSNLKIATLGAYDFTIKFKEGHSYDNAREKEFTSIKYDIQQKVVNGFLATSLQQIADSTDANIKRNIKVKLLVPNVLEQNEINQLVKRTESYLLAERDTFNINAFEVDTISESDASFLGYWQQNESKRNPDSRYLIIDMGKGTTDFSIIDANENSELSSEFRSGFIGGGQVITYAFVETIFTALFGTDSMAKKRAMHKFLLKDDNDAFKIDFLNKVERIKREYQGELPGVASIDSYKEEVALKAFFKSAAEGDLDVLEDKDLISLLDTILSSSGTIKDEYGYVNRTIERILGKLLKELIVFVREGNEKQIDKIILTGRSFLFRPLLKRLRSIIKETTAMDVEKDIIILNDAGDSTILKKICLEGAANGMTINYESNLSGFPIEVDKSKFLDEDFFPSDAIVEDSSEGKNRPGWANLLRRTADLVKGKLDELNEEEDELSLSDIIGQKQEIEEEVHELKAGRFEQIVTGKLALAKKYFPNKDHIYINGVYYKVAGVNHPEKFEVFYDGQGIYLRNETKRCILEVPRAFFRRDEFVFKTLFPFNKGTENEVITDDYHDTSFII